VLPVSCPNSLAHNFAVMVTPSKGHRSPPTALLLLAAAAATTEVFAAAAEATCSGDRGGISCDGGGGRIGPPKVAMLQTHTLQGTATFTKYDMKLADGTDESEADAEGKGKPMKKGKATDEDEEELAGEGEVFAYGDGVTEEEEGGVDTSANKVGPDGMDADGQQVTKKESSGTVKLVKKAKVSDQSVAVSDAEERTLEADEDEDSSGAGGVNEVEEDREDTVANEDGASDEVDNFADAGKEAHEEEADQDSSVNKGGHYAEHDQDDEAAKDKAMSSDEVEHLADTGAETSEDEADKSIIGSESKLVDEGETPADSSWGPQDEKAGERIMVNKAKSDVEADNFADGGEQANKEDVGEESVFEEHGTLSDSGGEAQEKVGKQKSGKKARSSDDAFVESGRETEEDEAGEDTSVEAQDEEIGTDKSGNTASSLDGANNFADGATEATKEEAVEATNDESLVDEHETLADSKGDSQEEQAGEHMSAKKSARQDESVASAANVDDLASHAAVRVPAKKSSDQGDQHSKGVKKATNVEKAVRKNGDISKDLFKTLLLEARKEIINERGKQVP